MAPGQTIQTIFVEIPSESSDLTPATALSSTGGIEDDDRVDSNTETHGSIRVSDEAGGRFLTAWVREVGNDVVVAVGGGDLPHVGCVVLAVPNTRRGKPGCSPATSVVTIPPHKEEAIARPVAEAVCGRLGRVTVVTAGVHEDGIDRAGIEVYLRLAEELADAVVAHLGGRR